MRQSCDIWAPATEHRVAGSAGTNRKEFIKNGYSMPPDTAIEYSLKKLRETFMVTAVSTPADERFGTRRKMLELIYPIRPDLQRSKIPPSNDIYCE
jgi:hypothetical protein